MQKVKHDFQLANQEISFGNVYMIQNCFTLFDRNSIIKLQNQTWSGIPSEPVALDASIVYKALQTSCSRKFCTLSTQGHVISFVWLLRSIVRLSKRHGEMVGKYWLNNSNSNSFLAVQLVSIHYQVRNITTFTLRKTLRSMFQKALGLVAFLEIP